MGHPGALCAEGALAGKLELRSVWASSSWGFQHIEHFDRTAKAVVGGGQGS